MNDPSGIRLIDDRVTDVHPWQAMAPPATSHAS